MEKEFKKWIKFYGKEHSDFTIDKGDFLSDEVKERVANAT